MNQFELTLIMTHQNIEMPCSCNSESKNFLGSSKRVETSFNSTLTVILDILNYNDIDS